MKTMLFIYNRHAGKEKTWANLPRIQNVMDRGGWLITLAPTHGQGDAVKAARDLGAGFDRIVVAGGDGTLSETVAGLMELPPEQRPVVGYIPVGTTNDFSRNLSLPDGLEAQAATAAAGVPRPCDLGLLNQRPFIYVAAFGAFTEVSYVTSQKAKNALGYPAYLMESIKSLTNIKAYPISVDYEGGSFTGEYIYGMVSNTTSVGSFRSFPPGDPKLDDGLLEVTLISPAKDLTELDGLGRLLLLGDANAKTPMLTTFSTPWVKITSAEPLAWTLDGEFGGAHPIADFQVAPRAFTIVFGA